MPQGSFYAGVDFFILLGVIRDLIVNRKIHAVYKLGLPIFVAGQAFALFVVVARPEWWAKTVLAVLG